LVRQETRPSSLLIACKNVVRQNVARWKRTTRKRRTNMKSNIERTKD